MDGRRADTAVESVRQLLTTPIVFVADRSLRVLRSADRDPVVALQLDPYWPDAPLWIVRCGELPPVSIEEVPAEWTLPPSLSTGIADARLVSFWDDEDGAEQDK